MIHEAVSRVRLIRRRERLRERPVRLRLHELLRHEWLWQHERLRLRRHELLRSVRLGLVLLGHVLLGHVLLQLGRRAVGLVVICLEVSPSLTSPLSISDIPLCRF